MTISARTARKARALVLGHQARFWFWKPQWHWFGWGTLSPIHRGHDEYSRWTVVFGWTITGRIIIALWKCGDAECESFARAS